MKPGTKFLIGALLIVGSVGFLIAQGVKETGVYFLTPTELAAKTTSDPTFYDVGPQAGRQGGAGLHQARSRRAQQVDFVVSDGARQYPVTLPAASSPTRSPTPMTSRSSSRGASAVTASSTPPKCSPSAAPATRPNSTRPPRPDRRLPDMTLLGNFALWAALLFGIWGAALAFSEPLAGPSRDRALGDALGVRRVRLAASWPRSRSGRASSPTTSISSTSGRTPRGTCRRATSSPRSGPARRARCCSGPWCCRCSRRWRRR